MTDDRIRTLFYFSAFTAVRGINLNPVTEFLSVRSKTSANHVREEMRSFCFETKF